MIRRSVPIILLLSAAIAGGFALDVNGMLAVEIAQQRLNAGSTYNLNNVHSFGTFETSYYGNIVFATEAPEIATGIINLECYSRPIYFESKSYGEPETESVNLKEIYATINGGFIKILVGKKYLPWSRSSFFVNVVDIVNPPRDYTRPAWEAQGYPLLQLSVPVTGFFESDYQFSLLSRAVLEEDIGQTAANLPLIASVAMKSAFMDALVFGSAQINKFPSVGGVVHFTVPLGKILVLEPFVEGLARGSPDKLVLTERNSIEPLSETTKYSLGMVAGARAKYISPTEKPIASSIDLAFEYTMDGRNWTREQYERYLNYLDKWRSDGANAQYYEMLSILKDFENSPSYIYASGTFRDFMTRTMDLGISYVMNMSDMSCMLKGDLAYGFGDKKMRAGVNAPFFFGNPEEKGRILAEVVDRSEFGTAIKTNGVTLYFDIFFDK